MKVFRVRQLPDIGDYFTYQGREYQLIENPTKATQYLYAADARYVWSGGFMEKTFFFDVE